jgi:hypothetical protein
MTRKGPFGSDFEEQFTATVHALRDDRQLVERVWELFGVVQSRPTTDDQARAALAQVVREVVAARGLDPNSWHHHVELVSSVFEWIWEEYEVDVRQP